MSSPFILPHVQRINAYHLDSYPQAIKLNQNESPWDLPVALKTKIFNLFLESEWNRYPLPQPEALLKKLSIHFKWPKEGLLVTNGSNVLIQALVASTAMGGRVLTLDPTFSLYELEGKLLGGETLKVPLLKNFDFPKESFLQALHDFSPNIVFIANPNAPTGNLFDPEMLVEVIEAARCLVVVDEAYEQFTGQSLLPLLQQFPKLVLLRTFSKAFGLGGVRLGFLLGHPEVVAEVTKLTLPYCVNRLSEIIGEVLLEESAWVAQRVQEICEEREKLYQHMRGVSNIQVFPSRTNFICFEVQDAPKTLKTLLEKGVLIRNVSSRPHFPNLLRVTVGTAAQNQAFLEALG